MRARRRLVIALHQRMRHADDELAFVRGEEHHRIVGFEDDLAARLRLDAHARARRIESRVIQPDAERHFEERFDEVATTSA